jgi:hypothetical protein
MQECNFSLDEKKGSASHYLFSSSPRTTQNLSPLLGALIPGVAELRAKVDYRGNSGFIRQVEFASYVAKCIRGSGFSGRSERL